MFWGGESRSSSLCFFGVANGKWQMVEIANKKKNMVRVGSVARGEHILYIYIFIHMQLYDICI
jgi:hypothetical protein